MSVTLNPSSVLSFRRPLTRPLKQDLTVTNPHEHAIAFKVKTTAPKVYCVRPNAGIIQPGQSVDVQVQLQAFREEPVAGFKCRDKFLVQSAIITAEQATQNASDIWSGESPPDVQHQKIRVNYLPAEGEVLLEEPEESQMPQSIFVGNESRQYDTVRESASGIDSHQPPAIPIFPEQTSFPEPARHTPSPPIDDSYVAAQEEQSRVEDYHREVTPEMPQVPPVVNVTVNTPPAISKPPSPFPSSEPNTELLSQLAEAQAEIQRLRALLAATPDPAELRRRTTRAVSEEDDDASELGTTVGGSTMVAAQEGASPQQVGIVALIVFIITYLFF